MIIPDAFQITQSKGEALIMPAMGVGNYGWKDWELRWLRSMHIDSQTQHIISVGWPKFMNLGEGPHVGHFNVSMDDILKRAGKDLIATLKVDGSLLIRFVHNGKVRWRTRGSLGVYLDNAYEIDEFCEKYPALSDPDVYPDDSILFEWVSPENVVVLHYPEPELILIGGICYHKDCHWDEAAPLLMPISELTSVAKRLGTPFTENFTLSSVAEITKLAERLLSDTKIEGYVLRFDHCQQMVKIKADHYLTKHALRSNCTTGGLVEMWLQWDKPDWSEYAWRFIAAYDYECYQWAMPAISSMFDGARKATKIIEFSRKWVDDRRSKDRKDFAIEAQQAFLGLRLTLMFTLLDNREAKDEFWKKLILQNCKQVEMGMFKPFVESDVTNNEIH